MKTLQKIEQYLVHHFWFLPPDIHERQRFIASLVKPGQKVLDVGGEQRILGEVTQASDFYTINVDTSSNQTPKSQKRTEKDLLYDGKKLPFEDKAFDVVVCIDVLEHVPPSLRRDLIAEMLRVTKKQLICSAPFGTPEHQKAEVKLYNHLKEEGKEIDFLKEHIEFGLPKAAEVQAWADEFGGRILYAGSFPLSNKLFSLHAYEFSSPLLNHLFFFFKSFLYLACNLFLYPFLVGKNNYSATTNRFYVEILR